jgi:hypothetical protein
MEACAALLPIWRPVPSILHTGHCSLLGVKVAVPTRSRKVGLRRGSLLRSVELYLSSYSLRHYLVRVGIHPVWGIVSSFPVYGPP